MPNLTINGQSYFADAPPDTPLLWVIREDLRLTGTKYGCGIGMCGSCTVHVDGQAVRSCSVSVGSVEGKLITTIEGLDSGSTHPVQQAWIEHQVPQCAVQASALRTVSNSYKCFATSSPRRSGVPSNRSRCPGSWRRGDHFSGQLSLCDRSAFAGS
jgi:isoquinoline 1-oxidoreductase alpha subunit